MSIRQVRCATCHEVRAVNAFGRCGVCGAIIAETQVDAPSRLRWHLREHGSLYAGVVLLSTAVAAIAFPAALGADPSIMKWPAKALGAVGGGLMVAWIKDRLV